MECYKCLREETQCSKQRKYCVHLLAVHQMFDDTSEDGASSGDGGDGLQSTIAEGIFLKS